MKQDPALPAPGECKIIRAIDPEGSVPYEDLCRVLGWKPPYISTLMHRLKSRGYAEVDYAISDNEGSDDPADKRYAFWSLTEMGLDMQKFLLDWGIGNV